MLMMEFMACSMMVVITMLDDNNGEHVDDCVHNLNGNE